MLVKVSLSIFVKIMNNEYIFLSSASHLMRFVNALKNRYQASINFSFI